MELNKRIVSRPLLNGRPAGAAAAANSPRRYRLCPKIRTIGILHFLGFPAAAVARRRDEREKDACWIFHLGPRYPSQPTAEGPEMQIAESILIVVSSR